MILQTIFLPSILGGCYRKCFLNHQLLLLIDYICSFKCYHVLYIYDKKKAVKTMKTYF